MMWLAIALAVTATWAVLATTLYLEIRRRAHAGARELTNSLAYQIRCVEIAVDDLRTELAPAIERLPRTRSKRRLELLKGGKDDKKDPA